MTAKQALQSDLLKLAGTSGDAVFPLIGERDGRQEIQLDHLYHAPLKALPLSRILPERAPPRPCTAGAFRGGPSSNGGGRRNPNLFSEPRRRHPSPSPHLGSTRARRPCLGRRSRRAKRGHPRRGPSTLVLAASDGDGVPGRKQTDGWKIPLQTPTSMRIGLKNRRGCTAGLARAALPSSP